MQVKDEKLIELVVMLRQIGFSYDQAVKLCEDPLMRERFFPDYKENTEEAKVVNHRH